MKPISPSTSVVVFVLKVAVFLVLVLTGTHAATPDVKVDVDWAEFMANLDPV